MRTPGLIKGWDTWQAMLRGCSLVVTRYGIPSVASGVIGMLGPTRMEYERAVAAVRFLSSVMGDLVSELHE